MAAISDILISRILRCAQFQNWPQAGAREQGFGRVELFMVPGAGIEPARLSAPDFKSGMSTNFIIRALLEQTAQ